MQRAVETNCRYFRYIAELQHSDTIIKGVCGKPVKAQGEIILPCTYKSVTYNAEFRVLDTTRNVNLLGRTDSTRFGLIARINNIKLHVTTEELLHEFRDVVREEIDCLPGEYEIKINKTIQSVVHAPRPVPAAIRNQVKVEIENLQECGITTPVTDLTDW